MSDFDDVPADQLMAFAGIAPASTLGENETAVPPIRPIPQYTERGVKLLHRIWEGIKSDPSAWNQGTWIGQVNTLSQEVRDYIKAHQAPPWDCGTAYCVAGHVALATGAKIPGDHVDSVAEFGRILSVTTIITPEGYSKSVEDYARQMLQLSYEQA